MRRVGYRMNVTGVETRPIRLPLDKPLGSALGAITCFGCILVTVRCDSGVVGENLVFTLNDRRTAVVRKMIDELSELVIGRDAGHIAEFWARAWKDINFIGHAGVPVMAISAIDGALWDALGKSADLPIHRLLGGAKSKVAVYHSGGLWLSHSERELIEEAEQFVASGFKAIKMRLGSADPMVDAGSPLSSISKAAMPWRVIVRLCRDPPWYRRSHLRTASAIPLSCAMSSLPSARCVRSMGPVSRSNVAACTA